MQTDIGEAAKFIVSLINSLVDLSFASGRLQQMSLPFMFIENHLFMLNSSYNIQVYYCSSFQVREKMFAYIRTDFFGLYQ